MFLIGIVDECEKDRQRLKQYIEDYFEKKEEFCIIHQFSDGVEFIRSREKYNIVFLETSLKEMDGLEVAHFIRIVNKEAQIVFVTYEAQLAIRGYEVDAADFMVKPVESAAMEKVLDKVIKRIDLSANVRVPLRTSNGLYGVSIGEIRYIEVYDHDLIYHTEQGELIVRGKLGDVYQELKKYRFVQCNRSYLVNMRYIKSIHKDYVMVDDVQIRVAKSRQKELEQRFICYLEKSV